MDLECYLVCAYVRWHFRQPNIGWMERHGQQQFYASDFRVSAQPALPRDLATKEDAVVEDVVVLQVRVYMCWCWQLNAPGRGWATLLSLDRPGDTLRRSKAVLMSAAPPKPTSLRTMTTRQLTTGAGVVRGACSSSS